MFMAGTGFGGRGCSQGTGSGSAGCNPRKFSEKIALHTQRQAEDTAAFQEVMMDITSTKLQAQRARQARNLAQYGGSLPNVNQIVRATCDTQGQMSYNPEHICAGRRHLMSDQSHRERRLSPPGRPNRRHTDSAPYHSVHQSPPPGSYWRRNWPNSCTTDKGQEVRLPATALNRTNSDSALHTTVRNTHIGDQMSSAQALTPRNRRSAFPYPVPLIEENVPEESKPLKSDCKKLSEVPSGSAKASSQHAMPTPSQQGGSLLPLPSSLNLSGSLPDLSSLHLPSPQPTGLEVDPLGQATCLASSSSSDHLPGGLTHPGLKTDDAYHLPGLSPMPVSLSNPLLQSSLSSPNIQMSLGSNSLPSSLSSASLHLSLSNSSLKSSLSNQSLLSSLSSSSLSNQSLQSAASHCSYSSGIGGSRSCSSSSLSGCSRASNQSLPPAASRKRNQLSPLILPSGGESRWHHPKQFSPTVSPTLSSITQGVLLNTSQVSRDSRPPAYPYNQPQHAGPPLSQQPLQHFPYAPTEGQLHHHQLPEPPVHGANLPPSHPAPMPMPSPSQRPHQQSLQHQPYQPPLYPKRQLPQCQPHTQPNQQPQSHLLKHLQAPSPPPPQLQPYHSQDQASSGPHPHPHTHPHPHPHPPLDQQHLQPHQQPYHCEPSQPLHHVGPSPQQPYHPQPFTQQQHQQSQWPPAHHLQPDHYGPHIHHHHHQQQQQQQQQQQHQHHPPWPSANPASMPSPNQGHPWQKESALHGALSAVEALPAQEPLRAGTPMRMQGHRRSKSQLQEAVAGGGLPGSPQKMAQSLPTGISSQSGHCLDTGIGLNESYMGLHLTPSQTKALSQQLGQLCKEPGSSGAPDPGMQSGTTDKEAPSFQSLEPGQDQKPCAGMSHNLSDTMLTDATSWLDQEIAGFPAHMLELDEEALELSILRDEEFTSESAVEGTFYNPAN